VFALCCRERQELLAHRPLKPLVVVVIVLLLVVVVVVVAFLLVAVLLVDVALAERHRRPGAR
jgi:hypothetical protein